MTTHEKPLDVAIIKSVPLADHTLMVVYQLVNALVTSPVSHHTGQSDWWMVRLDRYGPFMDRPYFNAVFTNWYFEIVGRTSARMESTIVTCKCRVWTGIPKPSGNQAKASLVLGLLYFKVVLSLCYQLRGKTLGVAPGCGHWKTNFQEYKASLFPVMPPR